MKNRARDLREQKAIAIETQLCEIEAGVAPHIAEEASAALVRLEAEQKARDEAEARELAKVEAELSSKGEGERMAAVRAVESLKTKIEAEGERAGQLRADRSGLAAKLPTLSPSDAPSKLPPPLGPLVGQLALPADSAWWGKPTLDGWRTLSGAPISEEGGLASRAGCRRS